MSAKYTFGGLPAEQALHWDDTTKKRLGDVVFLVSSGVVQKRIDGYNKWYYLKREFLLDEFDEYVDLLDEYRVSRGAQTLRSIINEIGEQFVENGVPLEAEPSVIDIPDLDLELIEELVDQSVKEVCSADQPPEIKEVVQLDLFG